MQMIKTDIYSWYETDQFETAIEYAEQNSSIDGVSHYLYELQELYQEYNDKMEALLQEQEPILDELLYKRNYAEKTKNICKWASILSFIFAILFGYMGLPNILANIIAFLMGVIIILGIPAAILLKITSILLARKYNSCLISARTNAEALNQIYLNEAAECFHEVDNLYLNSLDPTHRETVLMRREQEQQHQEQLRLEQERIRIENERLQHQKEMEDAQKRTLQATEQLLKIEEEREKRRGHY